MERVLLVLVGLAMAGMGCTQSDNVGGGTFTFDLPTARFGVSSDPNDPHWRSVPPLEVPDVLCRGAAALTDDCCNPPAPPGSTAPHASVDCQLYPLSCDAAGWCALAFDYDVQSTIDLGSSVSDLHERRGWVLANADLDVIKSTLDLPARMPIESATLYVAPQGVLSPKAPESRYLASIPLDQDSDPKEPLQQSAVTLGADARFVLSSFLADFNTPFTLILGVRVAIEAPHTVEEREAAKQSQAEIRTATFSIGGKVRASF
jgi:hypothetical protein